MAMTSMEHVWATMNFEPVDRPAVFPLENIQAMAKAAEDFAAR